LKRPLKKITAQRPPYLNSDLPLNVGGPRANNEKGEVDGIYIFNARLTVTQKDFSSYYFTLSNASERAYNIKDHS
jgi:hypothetical protein